MQNLSLNLLFLFLKPIWQRFSRKVVDIKKKRFIYSLFSFIYVLKHTHKQINTLSICR